MGYLPHRTIGPRHPLYACTPLRGGTAAIGQPLCRKPLLGRAVARWLGVAFVALWVACAPTYEPPTTAIDCGRQFLEAVYDGNFKRARQLITDNSQALLEQRFVQPYQQLNSADRDKLRNASINIQKIELRDNNRIVMQFTNALSNAPDSILVRRIDLKFVTDLKP